MTALPAPRAGEASRGVLFHGPPGIGKTHAWVGMVHEARAEGFRVLMARPSEAEARLVGSALVDLFGDVGDDVLGSLPAPQYAALAEALRRTTGEVRADPTTVAAAFASALAMMAQSGPVLLAVDDIQWLDRETADLLSFAARRLPPRDVLLLMTLRTEPGVPEPPLVTAAASALPLHREPVAPLEAERLVAVVQEHTGVTLAGQDRKRVLDLSQGNPLFAIELVRQLGSGADDVRLPDSLKAVTDAALSDLPAATVEALAAAAALGAPTLGQLAALGMDGHLAPAEHAGLLSLRGRRIRFLHPLYAAAAYERLSGAELLELHRRLARVVDDPEERARHLALAAPVPDPELALLLDHVAERARSRGALWAALDAVRQAISLSPDGDERAPARRLRLGEILRQVGETEQARDELTRLAEGDADPDLRAAACRELALILLASEGATAASRAIAQGLTLASDPSVRADLHLTQAMHCESSIDQMAWHCDQASVALSHLDTPDPLRGYWIRLRRREADWLAARSVPDLALLAESPAVDMRLADQLDFVVHRFDWQLICDQTEEARDSLEELLGLADLVGDGAQAVQGLLAMASHEEFTGNLARGAELLDAAEDLARQSQLADYLKVILHARQRLEVISGRSQLDGTDGSSTWAAMVDASSRGLLAYLQGDHQSAVEALGPLNQRYEAWGILHPRVAPAREYYIESLIMLGQLAEAEAALSAREERSARTGSRSVEAMNHRCRALLHAAQANEAAAMAAVDRAIEMSERLGRSFDLARSLLTKGQIARRAKRRGEARRCLEIAMASFAAMGAGAFVTRAQAELSRVSGRGSAEAGLTETEQRIVELTARGLTTKETATELFLSTKTVSNQLTSIYRKLGVRNRSELAAGLGASLEPTLGDDSQD